MYLVSIGAYNLLMLNAYILAYTEILDAYI